MIPNGWELRKLQDCGIKVIDGDRGKSYPSSDEFSHDGYCLFLSAKNVTKNGFVFEDCQFITEAKHKQMGKGSVMPGDLVLTTRGTVGNVGYLSDLNGFEAVRINSGMVVIRNSEKVIENEFLHALFRSPVIEKQIERMNFGSAQPQLTVKIVQSLKLPIPPAGERLQITDALETWTRAIKAVEALIANAQVQKQALMQRLFTGQQRLPGFSGAWTTTTLGSVAQIIVSNVDKKSVDSERPVRLCNYMDVYRLDRIEANLDFMSATATEAQIRKFGLRVGDVLITKDSETPDDIAIPSIVGSAAPDLICGYHLAIIRPKNEVDGMFLKFYFEHPHTRQFFASRANGATRFGLTIDAIETAPITLPSFLEQQRIGQVIGAAEIEIAPFQSIMDALRREKAALMQQLLTGKRRVKLNRKEAA